MAKSSRLEQALAKHANKGKPPAKAKSVKLIDILDDESSGPDPNRVALAIVSEARNVTDHESLVAVLSSVDCTYEQYAALLKDKTFQRAKASHEAVYDSIHMSVARHAVIEAGKEGNAYAFKTAVDTADRSDLTDDERDTEARMAVADKRILRREVKAQLTYLLEALQLLDGCRYEVVQLEQTGDRGTPDEDQEVQEEPLQLAE